MKILSIILVSLIFSCSSVSFSSEQSQLIKEMTKMKVVEKKSINNTFALFIKVNKSLEVKLDKAVIKELARLLVLTFKVDSNYYTVEPFTGVIKKNEKAFLKALKEQLPKEEYSILKSNIKTMKDEMLHGNG